MAKQEQVQKQKGKTRTEDTHTDESNVDVTNAELAEKTEQVVADIDDVLDEQLDAELLADMDEVLGVDEEEAAQMVAQYIQQGGE